MHYIWLCILDVLSVRLLQGTVWFCINLDVLRASSNVADFGMGQADNHVLIERFCVDRIWTPILFYFSISMNKYISIYLYISIHLATDKNLKIYIGKNIRNDLWAVLTLTYRVTRFSDVLSVRLPQGIRSTSFNQFWRTFFPTSQVRVVRFYHSCSSPSPSPSPSPPPRQSSSPTSSPILIAKLLANPLRKLLIAVGTAGPQLPASDRSGHPWASTASVSSQLASLDLNRQRRIPVGTPGPQPPASDLSGHPWTSTTRFYHQTLSHSIITKHHHKASSQYIITRHHHRPSSQIIITDHLHKTSSQYIITKHHHKSLSQIIFTKHVLIQCLNAMVGITRSKVIFLVNIWFECIIYIYIWLCIMDVLSVRLPQGTVWSSIYLYSYNTYLSINTYET